MDYPEGHYVRPDLLLMTARSVVPTDLMALRSQPSANPLSPGEDNRGARWLPSQDGVTREVEGR